MAKKSIDKIMADLAKASARFETNKPTTSAKQTSNFTYGTGNPLSDVGFYAASGKTPTSSLPDTSDEATDFEPGGFTPVVYGGTITLPNGDVVEVASGQRQGPVDNYGDPGDINNNPIDPTFKAYDLPKKPDDKKPDDKTSKDLSELNAYALLEELFRMYGLEELVPVIQGYMADGVGSAQAKILLKTNEVYKTRFKGNELRVAQGLNAISEAEYLALENDYSETLRAYGVSDFFGPMDANGRKARTAKMAEVIGFDLSANQFNERISTAVTRVKNADAGTKNAFASLYGVTDSDLIKYFLDPVKGSADLKAKVTAAEISGASVNAGLGMTSLGTSEELAKLGIDKAAARVGYENIANYLPRTTQLGEIYNQTGINYTKATGEEEEFKGLASAKRKRQQLKQLEKGSFSGSSGTTKGSFSTSYLNKQSSAGQF